MVSTPLVLVVTAIGCCNGLLFPKDSPSRLVKDLNGVWKFKIDDSPSRNDGFNEKWYSKPLSQVTSTRLRHLLWSNDVDCRLHLVTIMIDY